MASAISYEFLQARKGAANGIASLDTNGKVPLTQLPAEVIETYKGEYATSAALMTAYPAATQADYAYVTETNSYWYWNAALAVEAWVNQQITETAYNLLTTDQKAAVPYIILP